MVHSNLRPRPPLKKSLFPVQRVAIIVASREAAKSFFSPPLYRNGQENAGGKKRKIGKCEKNMPTRHLKSHPAGGQETQLFLRVAQSRDFRHGWSLIYCPKYLVV